MGVKDLAPALSIYRQRLRTPIMYPLCITSNFSNFSHFLSSSLLACQQLPHEGHGHFDRSMTLESHVQVVAPLTDCFAPREKLVRSRTL